MMGPISMKQALDSSRVWVLTGSWKRSRRRSTYGRGMDSETSNSDGAEGVHDDDVGQIYESDVE